MANKVQFGLSNVWFALLNIGSNGEVEYGTPHKHPGAVNLTLDPNGSDTPFYADNITYYTASANQGYTGSIEMALFDEWFQTNVLGNTLDENGVMVENANTNPKPVAILYQVEGDEKAARRVLYNVQVSRGSDTAATKGETTEPQTSTMNITVSPLPESGIVRAHTTQNTDAETFNAWYNEVYIPSGEFTADVTLRSLSLGTVTLEPTFAPETVSYTATTTNATNTINAQANDPNATVSIMANDAPVSNGSAITWQEDSNTVVITVENGGQSKAYTITVTKGA